MTLSAHISCLNFSFSFFLVTTGQENSKFLGTFYNKQNYVDLFIRLHGNYFSNYTSTNENNLDKTGQLRAVALHTLSTIIKNCGASIIPHGDEIMYYLKFLYPYEQKVNFHFN